MVAGVAAVIEEGILKELKTHAGWVTNQVHGHGYPICWIEIDALEEDTPTLSCLILIPGNSIPSADSVLQL